MRITVNHSPRGIALIIVLISVVVLAVLAGGFAYSMKVETKLARNEGNSAELEWLGRSGVEYARFILAEQLKIAGEPYDAMNQKWAGGPGGIATSNSPLADIDLNQPLELGDGKVTIKIVDCERKININLANETILQQALTQMGVEASEITAVANAILDWIDRDDATRVNGAESDYYQSLPTPYVAKNGPLDDISELLLIKGAEEVFSVTNRSRAAFQVKGGMFRGAQGPTTAAFGLVDIFTPISSGQVNMNTASAEVLQAILGVDQNAVQRIIEFRNQGEGMQETMPIGSPGKGIREALLYALNSNQAALQFERFFSTRSRTFEVQVDAEVNGFRRHFLALVGRNSARDIPVLSFYAQ